MAALQTNGNRIRIADAWHLTNADSISTPEDKNDYVLTFSFEDGSGDNQFQEQFKVQATVLIGEGNEDQYDLAGGVANFVGDTITFATIKEILLYNRATTSGEDLTLGGNGAATTGALLTDIFGGDNDARIKVKAGGAICLVAPLTGYTVTGGSADILVVNNVGTGSITYDLIVKGTGTVA